MYLREMKDKICLCVSAWDHIEPQLPHEEHKVGDVDRAACRTHTHTPKRFLQVSTRSKVQLALQSDNVCTVFNPLGCLGPVSDLSQTIKEVVCVIQTENLK